MLLHVLLCVATSLPPSVPTLVMTLAYRAALPAEFRAANPPPMYITLYFLVTRLPESLRVVRDQFLSVCPTTLTVDLLEESLLAAEKSIVAVGASRGDPRTPIFEGRSVRRLPPAVDAALARARGARERVELEEAVAEEVGWRGGVGVAVEVVAGSGGYWWRRWRRRWRRRRVAEEAGARVPVGAVAVETGAVVEAGVAVAAGSECLVPAQQLWGWSAPAAAAAAAAALSHRPRPSAAP
ncbi:unnamed protein product [Closterium sp. NIES-64]|nr:unnamed protein product [Closterium sp. NIES-64]